MAEHWEFFRRCGRQWQNIGSSLEGGRQWQNIGSSLEGGRQWQNIGSSLEGVGDNGRTLGVL